MVRKKLDDFGMQSPRRDNEDDFKNEIARELDYDFIALQQQVEELIQYLCYFQSKLMFSVKFYIE